MSLNPYVMQEGSLSFALDAFDDKTINTFVFNSDEHIVLNLMVSRAQLAADEDLAAYVTRQINALEHSLQNHRHLSRKEAMLGTGAQAIAGEVIEIFQDNDGKPLYQRQAIFVLPSPFSGKILLFSLVQDTPFTEPIDKAWRQLLGSFRLRKA
jgi:hypothetical protein